MKKSLAAGTMIVLASSNVMAVEAELYGQLNKGLFGYDDGVNSDVVVVDNNLSSTRFGMKGKQKMDNGLTASFMLEGEMMSNNSASFTQIDNSATGDTSATPTSAATGATSFIDRQANVGLSGDFGGAYVGMLSTAIDGVMLQDLGGVQDVMTADYRKIGSGLKFRTEGTNALSSFTVGSFALANTTSRANAVRYDTPVFNGFQGKAAISQGGDMDMSAFYAGDVMGLKAKAAAGMLFNNDNTTTATNTTETLFHSSLSLKHSSGIAGTLAYGTLGRGQKTAGADDGSSLYAKISYGWDVHEVAADWGTTEQIQSATAADSELASFGLGYQRKLIDGVTVSAMYRNFDAKVTGSSTNSIDLYGVNMRVKF